MVKMLYRLYQPRDFDALYAVEQSCFALPLRFSRAYMSKLVGSSNAATWIAEEEGVLAGFAIVEWTQETGETAAYIDTIEVAPAWRKRGLGAELLRRVAASAAAAGASFIWLHVETENLAAIALYESSGYLRQGREERFYASSRAAYLYAKRLTGE
jgi:ribosomal protein S18 acetylase RimI-like enzyme